MDSTEQGRRIKAARVYAGFERDEFARILSVSPSTLDRIERGKPQLTPEQLELCAQMTKLPIELFTMDLERAAELHRRDVAGVLSQASTEIHSLAGRVANLETQMAAMVAGFTQLDERTRRLETESRERDREALQRELEAAAERDARRRGRSASSRADPDARSE